ncbi:homocysteine-responsive endoplasmic reticulum-resident ubiquitin-like domain member 1 protein [Bombina bombina]|uniref:homocysteine-responsive endoplasmic reticulum-resident ubiquitin-like domain member 1 protein n=1 Tax=Bombina bombina TaxID=8345 RepID=UPI00235A7944|nr:homocysteine-responsive endoplasmic reticulum-resident ubiquitin-like domain member 1 protein [Bombina bombina]
MADGEVTLLIRSPSLKREEKEICVQRGCTVLELKAQLRRELPGELMEQDQRLIYSGKLLPDHLKLNEVLSTESRHVLHLVCSARNPPKIQTQVKKQGSESVAGTSHSVSPSVDGLRQRILPQSVSTAEVNSGRQVNMSPQGAYPAQSPYSIYSPQQILWLQQIYARQYYMQYFAAAASASPASHVQRVQEIPVVAAAAPDQLPQAFPVEPQPGNLDPQAPANPGANPNLHMDARGRLLEEEEDVNRDWLHWLYTAARFSIFLSFLYFYSTLSRFLMVLGAMLLMYLHHAGLFPFRRPTPEVPPQVAANPPPQAAANPPPQAAANPPPQAAANHQDQNNNLQEENEQVDEEFSNPTTAAAALQAQSFVTTAWIFFKTFFASLIPEGPQAVA